MRAFLDAAADLLLGATCPGCRAPGLRVCEACSASVDLLPRHVDRGVGIPLVAAAPYRPILEHVIPRYKDDGALHLDVWLGALLARAVGALDPPPGTVLVPMPSLPEAVRARGYDHAFRLARAAARRASLATERLLTRRGGGADQRGLSRDQRAANLHGALAATPTARPVLLVDDVATTGASLREAIRVLEAVGVKPLGAAVIGEADK